MRYVLESPDLPKHFDGCNAAFSILHDLDCKKGGLVRARQNELYDGVVDLSRKTFTLTHVRDNQLIFSGRAMQSPTDQTFGTTHYPSKKKPEATE